VSDEARAIHIANTAKALSLAKGKQAVDLVYTRTSTCRNSPTHVDPKQQRLIKMFLF
jgi:hypothetical protein